MAVVLRELIRNYKLWIYEYSDQRTINWPLMSSPIPILAISGIYLFFVLKMGPAFMKNRKAFQLDKTIQLYNIIQVILCGHLTYEGITKIYGPWGKYSILCQPLDFEDTEENRFILRKIYLYFLLKVIDLLDTIFFVLRKKQNQITFLHVYHHVIMIFIAWVSLRFIPGGHGLYTGYINCVVHTVMYGYYFLTNYDKEYKKKIWWKKYVTQFQLFQFASVAVHAVILMVQPNCEFPKFTIFVFLPQNLFFAFLFWDFYKKTYLTPDAKSKTVM